MYVEFVRFVWCSVGNHCEATLYVSYVCALVSFYQMKNINSSFFVRFKRFFCQFPWIVSSRIFSGKLTSNILFRLNGFQNMEVYTSAIKKIFFVVVIQSVYCYLHHTYIARWRRRILPWGLLLCVFSKAAIAHRNDRCTCFANFVWFLSIV